ncbi:SPOR domain-containing protein [Mesobacillus zeae]|uniref:SPOR domain-containing protein n=1 Tax=Mesobacillus zeae TaxID=1917180 RepID=UPI0015E71FAC|nr:SPOR domain-containing protein [Mesobacillus zeae]
MDKRGKTITIKINGEDRPFKRTQQAKGKERKRTIPPGTDLKVGHWKETAAARENDDESFDWILPDPVHKTEKKDHDAGSDRVKKENGSFRMPALNKSIKHSGMAKRVLGAVACAIVIGVALGYAILSVVTSGTAAPGQNEAASLQEDAPAAVGKGTAKLTPIETFIIQGGVYTSMDSAEKTQKDIEAKGMTTAIIQSGGKYTLILDAAPSIEVAKQKAAEMKGKGIDAFAKPITIGGGQVKGVSKEETEILTLVPNAVQAMLTPGDVTKAKEIAGTLKQIPEKDIESKKIKSIKTSLSQPASQGELLKVLAAYSELGQ